MKKAIIRIVGLAIVVALGYYGYRYYKQMPRRQEGFATAKVQRGDVVIRAYTRGQLQAVRSFPITAPNLFGTVQVTQLAPAGALAKEKDLIVEYDDSERQASLEEARLEVQQVDEQIKKLKADQAIQQSQDKVDLLKAQYAVRRAELEVQRNPVIDAIDAKKNILELDKSRRALQQLETDIDSRQKQLVSQLAVLQESRNRDLLNVNRELQRIALTRALTPMSGLVAIKPNRAGNFNFGQQMPDIRVGDELQPGMPVADILDLSEVEVVAKVGEIDRANLIEGQEALLQLDSIPEKQFHGKIKSLSGTATTDVFSGDPSKKFDVVFSVNMPELLAGLGVKPAEIERIMTTAAENAKKNFGTTRAVMGGVPGGAGDAPSGGGRGMGGGFPGATDDTAAAGGQQAGGRNSAGGAAGRGAGGRANLSDEERQKMRALFQQAQNASPEEREKLMAQLRQGRGGDASAAGRGGAAGAAGRGDDTSAGGRGGDASAGGRGADAGAGGRGGRSGAGAAGAGPAGGAMAGGARGIGGFGFGGRGTGQAGDDTLQRMMGRAGGSRFSEEERNNAKLPLPPEEDSDVQALLRPGLLADVEIIVERIPNALHVPAQAIFQKNGQATVFVQQKNGRFEPRAVKLAKQSESMMVLQSGVNPGEIVSLADPTAEKSSKKGAGDSKSQGNPMGAMGGGKQ